MALDDRVLASGSTALSLAAAIESLIVLAAVGVFDVVSSIMAPVFIHRFLMGHAGPASLVPQTLGTLATVLLPALGSSAHRVVEFVRSHLPGRADKGGPTDPPVPPPPPTPPPPPPGGLPPPPGRPSSSDPTGARELERLLNGD